MDLFTLYIDAFGNKHFIPKYRDKKCGRDFGIRGFGILELQSWSFTSPRYKWGGDSLLGRFSDFEGLVTLTLTLDRVILHTIMHHSSTFTYIPSFIEIEKTFCGRTDVRTDGRAFETLLGRLGGVDLRRMLTTLT